MNTAGNGNALNQEFYNYSQVFKRLLTKLSQPGKSSQSMKKSHLNACFLTDKNLANKWITKLSQPTIMIEDMKKRNTIMNYLVQQMQMGALSAPFNAPPNYQSLSHVQGIPDMSGQGTHPEGLKLPMIMKQSPDNGAFLVTQPVPKCGAFCYLAVVSRPSNN